MLPTKLRLLLLLLLLLHSPPPEPTQVLRGRALLKLLSHPHRLKLLSHLHLSYALLEEQCCGIPRGLSKCRLVM